jgi:hypothetical protein
MTAGVLRRSGSQKAGRLSCSSALRCLAQVPVIASIMAVTLVIIFRPAGGTVASDGAVRCVRVCLDQRRDDRGPDQPPGFRSSGRISIPSRCRSSSIGSVTALHRPESIGTGCGEDRLQTFRLVRFRRSGLTIDRARNTDPTRRDRGAVFGAWVSEIGANTPLQAAEFAALAEEQRNSDGSFSHPALREAQLAVAAKRGFGQTHQIDRVSGSPRTKKSSRLA